METVYRSIVFLFGAIVGSFLNVCIYRLPLSQSVVAPRSFCPHCKKMIRWFDNIPFVSYILLGGKCRSCKKRISLRYFLVELLTAAMCVVLYARFGLGLEFFIHAVFVCGLIVATFVDFSHRIIPDEISLGGVVVGFVLRAAQGARFSPFGYTFAPVIDSLLGIIVGGGIIYLTGSLFDLVYFKLLKRPPIDGETESMGGGDVKLLAMIGAFLGWKMALLTFFLAPFFGVILGLYNYFLKKEHLLPYGPFLSLAAILCIFWGRRLLETLFFIH